MQQQKTHPQKQKPGICRSKASSRCLKSAALRRWSSSDSQVFKALDLRICVSPSLHIPSTNLGDYGGRLQFRKQQNKQIKLIESQEALVSSGLPGLSASFSGLPGSCITSAASWRRSTGQNGCGGLDEEHFACQEIAFHLVQPQGTNMNKQPMNTNYRNCRCIMQNHGRLLRWFATGAWDSRNALPKKAAVVSFRDMPHDSYDGVLLSITS